MPSNIDKLLAEVEAINIDEPMGDATIKKQWSYYRLILLPKLAEIVGIYKNTSRICSVRQDGTLDDGDAVRFLLRIADERAEEIAGK